ncbi:hypothetical protein JN538_03795 [Streptococcus suis]|uniref:TM2 domain-containing protein n=1 Tax=Streptococcus suis TaxID=1307 RepID=UPI00195F7495|nr:hypothetical protein [Streptococcus suis]MBM7320255.1 hypothetical protein [Streptococcus suis]HEM5128500.1 hypothetical protein [Streptococcus suis]
MKIGIRKPSLKKSLKARTTGKLKRKVKKALIPGYGKKGMGMITNPKKAVYNKIYNKTTIDVLKPVKRKSKKRQNNHAPVVVTSSDTAKYKEPSYIISEIERSKKTYILLSFLGGFFGLQYLYVKQYYRLALCILFCWTFIPMVIGLISGVVFIFKETDEFGNLKFKGHVKRK